MIKSEICELIQNLFIDMLEHTFAVSANGMVRINQN